MLTVLAAVCIYVLLGLSFAFVLALLTALFFLWRTFGEDARWRLHDRYTLATGTLAVLLLFLPGVAYYLFLVVLFVWLEVTAIRLRRLS